MVKDIYIVRHGQTDYNLRGIVQGSGVDASLNDNGRKQAGEFFNAYGDFPFDKLYISNLKRTYESVKGFIDKGLSYENLAGLNEISWGTREGQLFTLEENKYYLAMLDRWKKGETSLPVEGGESPDQVAMRQLDAMKYIMSKEDEQKVLICMHGRAMRILLAQLFNYPLYDMDIFEHSNLALYHIRATKNMFQLVNYNDRRHLSGSV
ncbi:histidine phosphatase family protein [Marivirga salinae]|uniref:Histidine phosphatase family protein n=1 Tax=Marivirga salinarum TaxID=3059078 RepID=A0AA49J8Z8_9BACT|nr:histidine phosphatase family protein [Marivirga sp. BDSF4-3]WKK78081.2 histidine phosphatase family protein [Marivirga sp. BDSF4-3]